MPKFHSISLSKLVGDKIILNCFKSVIILLLTFCFLYLALRPNIAGYDSSVALLPVAQTLANKSAWINQSVFYDLVELKSSAQKQAWFPIGYAFFPYLFSKYLLPSSDALSLLNSGVTATYLLFFIFGSWAWILLIKRTAGTKKTLAALLTIYLLLDWNLTNESIGFIYEWAAVPIAILFALHTINRKQRRYFFLLGGFLASLVLLKLSLLIFSVSILLCLIVHLAIKKKISWSNGILTICSFSFCLYFIEIYINSGSRPDHGMLQNIINLHIPYQTSLTTWLARFQAASFGDYWTFRNGDTKFPKLLDAISPFFYLSLIGIFVLLAFTYFKNVKYNEKKLTSDKQIEYSEIVNSLLFISILWFVGYSITMVFASAVGVESRYFVLPIKLFLISAFLKISFESRNHLLRYCCIAIISFFASIYISIHLANNYNYIESAVRERLDKTYQGRLVPVRGEFLKFKDESFGKHIFVSSSPEILLVFSEYDVVKMETFLKTYKKLPTNGNTDIKNLKKLRFIDRKNPKALINSLEHLLPMTKASWTREKIEKSGYSLVYLKDLVE